MSGRWAISTTSRRELSSSFFLPARQGTEENSRHSDRSVSFLVGLRTYQHPFYKNHTEIKTEKAKRYSMSLFICIYVYMLNHSTPDRLYTASAVGYCVTLKEPRTDIYIYIQLAVNLVTCEHNLSATQSCQLYIMTKNNGLSYICLCH